MGRQDHYWLIRAPRRLVALLRKTRHRGTAPHRGEIWQVNFNPARGSEQRGIRPALVIQNDVGNEFAGTIIVAATTTTLKAYPVTVLLRRGYTGDSDGFRTSASKRSTLRSG
jgi:mRNA interferase MazF